MRQQNTELSRRFAGVARVYGEPSLDKLAQAHICVIGIGGVGSWVAEALARSAVGSLTLIDMDVVVESNINRQILATTTTLGRDKIAVMQERIVDIHPDCKVHVIDDFISRDNVAALITSEFDFVVDCIDDFRTKAALIAHCKQHSIKIVTIGGAGGQQSMDKIRKVDLSRTQHDALLAKTRKLLRTDYRFPRNPKRSFSIAAIYSDEQPVFPDGQGGVSKQIPAADSDGSGLSGLSCAGGMGSLTHVTASFAFRAVEHVLACLVDGKA